MCVGGRMGAFKTRRGTRVLGGGQARRPGLTSAIEVLEAEPPVAMYNKRPLSLLLLDGSDDEPADEERRAQATRTHRQRVPAVEAAAAGAAGGLMLGLGTTPLMPTGPPCRHHTHARKLSTALSCGKRTRAAMAATKHGSEAAGGGAGRVGRVMQRARMLITRRGEADCPAWSTQQAGLPGPIRTPEAPAAAPDIHPWPYLHPPTHPPTRADLAGLGGQQVLRQRQQPQALRGRQQAQLLDLRQRQAGLLRGAASER